MAPRVQYSAVSPFVRRAVLPIMKEHGIPSTQLAWHLVALVRRHAPTAEISQTQIDLGMKMLGFPVDSERISKKRRDRVEVGIDSFTEEIRNISLHF